MKKWKKCYFLFGTYKKRFVIQDPKSLNSIPQHLLFQNILSLKTKFSLYNSEKLIRTLFHYTAMSMMTSQILKFVDFTKTQKYRYFKN